MFYPFILFDLVLKIYGTIFPYPKTGVVLCVSLKSSGLCFQFLHSIQTEICQVNLFM